MGKEKAHSGSPETVVFPGIPWLRDGTPFDAYLESCLAHLKTQEIPPNVKVLPPFITSTIDDNIEIPRKFRYHLTTPKLNEIVDAFQESEATHLLFLDADNEIPSDALKRLLEHDVDVASGISPPHKTLKYTTAFKYVPAPTPHLLASEPYFRPYKLEDIRHTTVGEKELVSTGHFCCLIKRRVFDAFRFRWPGLKVTRTKHTACPICHEKISVEFDCKKSNVGAEFLFWMDAQMLGYSVVIDGSILCGHLPEYPLSELVK